MQRLWIRDDEALLHAALQWLAPISVFHPGFGGGLEATRWRALVKPSSTYNPCGLAAVLF
jgi:hypothetical protein